MFGGRFDIPRKIGRLEEIKQLECLEGFWNDTEHAAKIQKEKNLLEGVIKGHQSMVDALDELDILLEYAKSGDEPSTEQALSLWDKAALIIQEQEQKVLLAEEFDANNAIVSINAGAGGTESCDWAAMLVRMVKRWAEAKGFTVKMFDILGGETAGVKSATFAVEGPFAYGLLQSESGVHRLVRISPFDSNARRHTSFASIFVGPEVDDTIDIQIVDKDIRIDVYRSGGAGGQSVNTTDSAVRITHFPSGIVVTCQNERSQVQNKLQAMKILKSRLYEKAMEEKRAKQNELENTKKDISWGAQIRSYVLHPYKLVKDHRTLHESSQAESVLEGDLDDFMKAYLKWKALGGIAPEGSEDNV
jgi:peptide chain release factor 2